MLPIIRPDVTFDEVADDLRAGARVRDADERSVSPALRGAAGCRGRCRSRRGHDLGHDRHAPRPRRHRRSGPATRCWCRTSPSPPPGNVVVALRSDTGARRLHPRRVRHRSRRRRRGDVTERTRAVIVVDPFGQPADVRSPRSTGATSHRLAVIEDAACALGSSREGVPCGAWPDVPGCFSFHPRKVVTTGEGGAVTTDDTALAERLRLLRSHGGARGPAVGLSFVEHGFNYRLSEVQAVIGLPQLRRLDADTRRPAAHGGCLRVPPRRGATESISSVPPAGERLVVPVLRRPRRPARRSGRGPCRGRHRVDPRHLRDARPSCLRPPRLLPGRSARELRPSAALPHAPTPGGDARSAGGAGRG